MEWTVAVPPGISQRDIAKHLGLSVSTVSRALSDNDRVSNLTKRAVQDAIETLAARERTDRGRADGATASRPMIGLTISHVSGESSPQTFDINFSEVLSGVEAACARAGYIPYPWQESQRLIDEPDGQFFRLVSGVIMVGGVVDPVMIDAVARHGIPAVVAGGQIPGSGISSVGSDNGHGIQLAVRHLLDRGHRRIGLINGPDETHTSVEKFAGYLAALAHAGIPFDPELVRSRPPFHGFSETAGDETGTELLTLPDPPTAIICAFDQVAMGVYRAAARLGRSIPRDLSVIGFHDDDVARSADPPLTTIRVRRSLWGEEAAEVLLRLRQPSPIRGTHIILPVQFIERASTAAPGTKAGP